MDESFFQGLCKKFNLSEQEIVTKTLDAAIEHGVSPKDIETILKASSDDALKVILKIED